MAKIKLHRLHKIKIHKNRWLIWALAYAVIVTIAVVGYIKVSDINFVNQDILNKVLITSRSYTDHRLGFGVRYPSDLGIESSNPSTVIFWSTDSKPEGVSVTVSVNPTSAEKAIRKSLKIVSETRTTVDGISAALITSTIAPGATESVVLVRANNQLYEIAGNPPLVQRFLVTFHFITPKK